jgi:hypothetical protein
VFTVMPNVTIKYNFYTNIVFTKTSDSHESKIVEGSIIYRKMQPGQHTPKTHHRRISHYLHLLSSRGNSKDAYTYGWYSTSVGNNDMQGVITRIKL